MTKRISPRRATISALLALVWLVANESSPAQIFQSKSETSYFSQPADGISSTTNVVRRLPDIDAVGEPELKLASTDDDDTHAEWIASAVRPASYSELNDAIKPKNGFTVGNCTIIPYGVLWADMIYASSRTVPGRFILWVQSDEVEGESTFQIEARYTRLGFDVKGPEIGVLGGLSSGGRVEVDFLGNFVTENQPDTRLRHAYIEAKNEYYRFLVGQYWDLVSPRLPNTVNFSVNWGVGNIGFRRTQFRAERYFHLSDSMVWSVEGALAQNVIQDFSSGEVAAGVERETGNWPMIQGRTALTFDRGYREPVSVGISGHVGESGFDFATGFPANPELGPDDDARFFEWSFNVDARVPVTDRLGIHGEFFTGANLSNLLGGIVQGVCPCLREPIRSTGGWAEIWYDVTSDVHAHVGYGIDDPNDNDLLLGRTSNQVLYANVFIDLTKELITGLEVSAWRTTYENRTSEPGYIPVAGPTEPGEAVAIDWTVRYKF